MKYLVTFAAAMLLIGCQKNISDNSYNIAKMPEEGILLNKWQILGPFPADGKERFLEVDNLQQFGFEESAITFDEFADIEPKDSLQIFKNQFFDTNSYTIDFNRLFRYTAAMTIGANVYCACVLQSDRERKLTLNYSSDDGSKIWLNNSLIFSRDNNGRIKFYDNRIVLNLKEGDNLLLIKVNNVVYGWEMFAAVEEETEEVIDRFKKTFRLEYGKYFLYRSVVTNDTLLLNGDLPREKIVFTLEKRTEGWLLSDSGYIGNKTWDISTLPEGLYSATLQIRDETFSESLYKGDIISAIDRMLKKLRPFSLSADTKRNVEALAHRYNHLLKPGNRGRWDDQRREWDKKMIFLLSALNRYYANISSGLAPDYGATGGLLKTYVSPIDGGTQYYQVFVPKNYRKEHPLPLVIELPKFVNWHPSPLETNRFANIRLFELFQEMADKYNVMILDPGCRTIDKSNMNAIDEADLWESLADIRKNYSIDTTRMYLRGACLSSWTAMKLAVKYPDKFAAIALVAPELSVSSIDNIYVQQNEPMNYLRNIINLPILDIHSKKDLHSPVEVSERLNEDAKEIGIKQFTYKRLPKEFKTYYSEEYMDEIFTFLIKHSLNPSPNEIYFSTSQLKYNKSFWLTLNKITSAKKAFINAKLKNNILTIKNDEVESYTIDLTTLPYSKDKPLTIVDNGKKFFDKIIKERTLSINPNYNSNNSIVKNENIEGPFAHVLTVPFVIVPGTIGDKQETRNIQALADTINKYWVSRYYSKCRMKLDREITERDIKDLNLVLIGTSESNLIFKRLANRLPVKIKNSSIEIGGNKADGTELGFYFVYPNPENPNKYVAIIGYNNPFSISLGYENDGKSSQFNDVSNYGWYDFKVWDAISSQKIVSGYFNYFWN